MQETISNKEACQLVAKVFKAIRDVSTLEELDAIVKTDRLLKNRAMPEKRYPKIHFDVSMSEIEELKRKGVLDNTGRVTLGRKKLSPLEKLLYAIVWKNGDLGKEHHIVRGINSSAQSEPGSSEKKGLVFFHFGRYLADRKNPIIDQHVIRSFRLYKLNKKRSDWDAAVTGIRSKGKVDEDTIRDYKKWLTSLSMTLRAHQGYRFHVDKVLFALGRAVKV